MTLNSFPKILKARRKEMNLSQDALATLIGKTHAAINRWESGKNVPSYIDFFNLCDALKIQPEELAGIKPFQKAQLTPLEALEVIEKFIRQKISAKSEMENLLEKLSEQEKTHILKEIKKVVTLEV